MIKIIQNNFIKEEDYIYTVTCPNCKSVFQYEIGDLTSIEKTLNGKRLIVCPCCGYTFDTVAAGAARELKNKAEEDKKGESGEDGIEGIPLKTSQSKSDATLRGNLTKDEKFSEIEEVNVDGMLWWKCTGYYRNRPEDRKLNKGDIIAYGRNEPKVDGFLLIKSFDYAGDIAARCAIGYFYGTYYSDFSPAFHFYRLATDEEAKDFLTKYKNNNPESFKFRSSGFLEMENFRYKGIIESLLNGTDE